MSTKISLLLLAMLFTPGCGDAEKQTAIAAVGGDPERGKTVMSQRGCVSCHEIPGITGADALVGPPLTHMASRSYVAGVMRNTPDNLIRWIDNPPAVDPKTAMPNLHLTKTDTRDAATFLYTLK